MDAPTLQAKHSHPLATHFLQIRQQTLRFCQPLSVEDFGLQAMAETSPPKWHLAHTTWFFETFILKVFSNDYQCVDPQYEVLFNSYYNGIGAQHPRAQRGLLSRPSVEDVREYRHVIDQRIINLLKQDDHPRFKDICQRLILGLHHEQQHQELLFTDLKYSWFQNPLYPVYCDQPLTPSAPSSKPNWLNFEGGLVDMGHNESGFCFDNELPRHKVVINPFALADRAITNQEFLEFIQDGGYRDPQWWLSDGWSEAQQQQWRAPLYWVQTDNGWHEYTLHGLVPLDLQRPVVHVSAYEADAFARWRGARLPTEQELEYAANQQIDCHERVIGQFVDSGEFHPQTAHNDTQLFGSVWEWTSSAYEPYPGYKPATGAIGEYNGKFMCNQLVLRGGSCVTSRDHIRPTYRNFFYPRDRWQFSGIRLAKSL